jgi:hypothetical protein
MRRGSINDGKKGRRNDITSSRRSSFSRTTPEKSSKDSPFWTGVFAISVLYTLSAITPNAPAVADSKNNSKGNTNEVRFAS